MPQQPPHRQPHQHTEAIPVSWEHRAQLCCWKAEHSLVRTPASSFHTLLKTQTSVVPRGTSQCTPKARPQGTVLWPSTLTWLCPEPGDQPGVEGEDLALFSFKFNIQINICMYAQNIHCPSDPREDGRPGQPQAGRRDGGRPQITLRTVFNICKTASRAAKVNRVPGSSKVSEFKCFPFA